MKNNYYFKFLVLFLLFIDVFYIHAQDPLRFEDEVARLNSNDYSFTPKDSIVVFTGSSSIRMWTDIQDYFPDQKIINTGFGGSHMSDLLYYHKELILKYSPYKVFIYEGDNDIASGKKPNDILETTDSLIKLLKTQIPGVKIITISAKPSIARWSFKKQFIELNQLFKDYCNSHADTEFIDVWDIMLNENKTVRKDIFIEDGLHMNKTGYDLWYEKIKEYL